MGNVVNRFVMRPLKLSSGRLRWREKWPLVCELLMPGSVFSVKNISYFATR